MQHESLEQLFEQAIEAFPYQLDPTSITQGDLEAAQGEDVEYAAEYIFEVGQLIDEKLLAGGWVELRREEDDITITAFFGIARNGDWEKGRILPEDSALQGTYDIETAEWELWIDQF